MPKAKKRKVVKKVRKIKSKKLAKRRKILVKKARNKKQKFKKIKRTIKLKKRVKAKSRKRIGAKQKFKTKKLVKKTARHRKVVKSKKIAAAKPKKHIIKSPVAEFPAESLFRAKIKVIGIGGGGGSIVSEIGRSLEKATFVVADTDIRALKKKSGIKYLWFGEELTHGLGTGVNIDLAKQAAESAKEKISGIFKDQDIIIFIASLGGGLGSGATQVFAEAAREFGGITFGIFTMPFKFEGKNKYRIAQNALRSLRQTLNVSLVIPNEKIFKIIDANTAITDAFSIVNKSLIESLESLIDLIYNPGIINIDFADLRTILRGIGNTAFLNTIEESGKNRVEKICQKVLVNPLLQNSSFTAEKILFNIAGSGNLSMFEVEKISSHIANLNPKAKIIFGISKDAKLKNKIKTTILMTGGAIKDDLPVKKEKSVEIIVKEPVKEVIEKKVEVLEKKPETKNKIKKLKKPKTKSKKPVKKPSGGGKEKQQKPVSFIPVFEVPVPSVPVVEQNRLNIVETSAMSSKKTIRRSGLEIKEAEELEEKKRLAQEKEWEIPAFLRKVKFKN
ncbi:MAG: cell division protein FtsZ [Candidatus Staskawiczbacteria bacterium]|jgi:cell division protein FtsZ